MLQNQALDILKMGHNVYLTGAAGSGKTHTLNQFISYLRNHNVSVGVTASTGIAATHMNGMTIHSWAGLGVGDSVDIKKVAAKTTVKKRIQQTKVLIIDEVSMLDGYLLDAVDGIAREVKDETKPFGGMQVVLSGDLFQLPPVTRSGDPFFVFMSNAWKTMNLKVCYLQEQHRQDDSNLLDILNAIRSSSIDESHFQELNERIQPAPKNVDHTKLYTHNANVDQINQSELDKLKTDTKIYYMSSSGRKSAVESLTGRCLAPEELVLKVDSEVMFVANNPAKNFYNGTLGRVVSFNEDGMPVVQTKNRKITVEEHSWKMEDGERTVAQISQLPLRLAWAITIHKSQGMSLDAAEVDLTKTFEPGMGYVALSRVRSIDGLYIKGINNMALVVNPLITQLDKNLMSKSEQAVIGLGKIEKKTISKHHKTVRNALRPEEDKMLEDYDKPMFDKLKTWRTKQAKEQSMPAYMVLSDNTLKLISVIKPKDKKQLSYIKGIGAQKLESYGEDVLKVLSQ